MPLPGTEQKVTTHSYEQPDDMSNAVLLVEGRKIYVVKELLMVASPVFKAMFTGEFREAVTSQVILTNKKTEHVIWMLDYIYPDKTFDLTDEMATKLLPLAEEYQLVHLREQCIDVLLEQDWPRLEIVTLAEKFCLDELLEISIDQCAKRVPSEVESEGEMDPKGLPKVSELDQQLALPENADLSKDALNKILRRKIHYAKIRFNEIKSSVDGIMSATTRVSRSDQDNIRRHRSKMNFAQGIF